MSMYSMHEQRGVFLLCCVVVMTMAAVDAADGGWELLRWTRAEYSRLAGWRGDLFFFYSSIVECMTCLRERDAFEVKRGG